MKKSILLLSPYDTLSHQYWWQGLQNNLDQYDWTILTLPARYFAWRMRGNSLSWAYLEKEKLEREYDLIIACSLTDLSSLRGFIPNLAGIPTIVYCHENQFYYPDNPEAGSGLTKQQNTERQIIQLYNFECADKVIFNSIFNMTSFRKGAAELLKKLPDFVPEKLLENIEGKSGVLPIPLTELPLASTKESVFSIVWNHRWEYDKGLMLLEKIIGKLVERKMEFRFHILGQQFREKPPVFERVTELLKRHHKAGHIGFMESESQYLSVLSESHLVLSTSLHEFQGIAIMEAVLQDCIPVLPDRLCYPEFFPEQYLYENFIEVEVELSEQELALAIEKESEKACEKIMEIYDDWQHNNLPDLEKLKATLPVWRREKAAYTDLIDSLID